MVFVLAFSVFVLAKAPARVIWNETLKNNAAIQASLRSVGVLIKDVEGSVWDGRALVQYKGISSIINWDMHLSEVFALHFPVAFFIESQAGELEALLTLGISEIELSVSRADVDLSAINPAIRSQRVTLDGQLMLKDVDLRFEEQKLKFAKGLVSWSGGDIAYPAQRVIHQRTLPSFRGLVDTNSDGEITAGVRDSGGAFDLIEANVSSEGEALVKVKRRLLDLADEHWPANSNEQDVVFKVKKKIY